MELTRRTSGRRRKLRPVRRLPQLQPQPEPRSSPTENQKHPLLVGGTRRSMK